MNLKLTSQIEMIISFLLHSSNITCVVNFHWKQTQTPAIFTQSVAQKQERKGFVEVKPTSVASDSTVVFLYGNLQVLPCYFYDFNQLQNLKSKRTTKLFLITLNAWFMEKIKTKKKYWKTCTTNTQTLKTQATEYRKTNSREKKTTFKHTQI